ncbi:hypothetical protein AC739_08120 [Planococcus glaciei]|uniref:type I restriction endonuclease n=1 Tax=Planococcus glaciei TaxID=459472 RepID=UPI00069E2E79|nr:type I restriction endonuclease [Planococcus glaciei]KOF10619.1 hypothetical protein AC739_08120 [Planococcus glaciei]
MKGVVPWFINPEHRLKNSWKNEIIVQLTGIGYEKVAIPDIKTLQQNFRQQISRLNEENLNGTSMSDKEFERLLLKIEGKSVYESAKILRDKQIITRDDDSTLYLQLMDTRTYKNVTHQTTVVGRYTNRYDVTVLLSGLPCGANEESVEDQEHSDYVLKRVMGDFNKEFENNHNTDNFSFYFADVSKKSEDGVNRFADCGRHAPNRIGRKSGLIVSICVKFQLG